MTEPEEITTQNSTVEDWTHALSEAVGSPGGGAGAGVMLGIAASLASMVAGYTEPGENQQEQLDGVRSRARNLRQTALQLADDDAAASHAFGSAFKLKRGPEREEAIHQASLTAAESSATLGDHATEAIADVSWLAEHGNSALIADVVVAFGALRAAVSAARTNVSFDLSTLRASGLSLDEVRQQHPALWSTTQRLESAIRQIDDATSAIDDRATPTDSA